MRKRILSLLLAVVMVLALVPVVSLDGSADGPVYYTVDYTADVEKSIITSHTSGDSAMIAAATAEAYKYGATSDADRKVVYDTVVSDSGGAPAAPLIWEHTSSGGVGYETTSYSMEGLYEQLSFGNPIIVVKGSDVKSYALVTGYTGPSDALLDEGFQVLDPSAADGSRHMNLKTWVGSSAVVSMFVRKQGTLISALDGIHILANHPAPVTLRGTSFIPYGEIVSHNVISEITVGFYSTKDGSALFSYTTAVNSKFYDLINLNNRILFGNYPEGDYSYIIDVTDTAGNTASYCEYFSIVGSYPNAVPAHPVLTVEYSANGGVGSIPGTNIKVGGSITLASSGMTKQGSTLLGWTLRRSSDNKYYSSKGWLNEAELTANKLKKTVFALGSTMTASSEWLVGGGTQSVFTFTAEWSTDEVFTDVRAGDYFHDPVYWAKEKNITLGTAADKFSPNYICTRAQVVTFLYRAAGQPPVDGLKCEFTDLDPSAYYYNAVLWAVKNGITAGKGNNKFEPDGQCTRDQVVTFLYRYAGKPVVSGTNPFTDIPQDEWYTNAVLWAKTAGITAGTDATHFSPSGPCTRGQVVTFLYRQLH